jgi:NAD(P)-dependent dehydrogenase (short-subunit alcohol dehydrogenase family)
MADSFEEKVAIVTGGASGIGEAVSLELARRGTQVTVADINGDSAERVAAAIAKDGGRAKAWRVDVTQEQDIRRLIEDTAAATAVSTTSSTTPASRSGVTPVT